MPASSVKIPRANPLRTELPYWVVVVLATLPMLGFWLTGLFDLDEGFYGAVVSEMNRRGEWITPYYNGQPWFEKPILLYWLAKPSLMAFGTWFGPRLPSMLCTVGLLLTCGWFAQRNLAKGTKSTVVFILGTSVLVLILGRLMMTDAPLNLAFAAAMFTFWESLVEDKRWRILTAVFLGFGVLAKGPVALLLFVPIAGWTYWREPNLRPAFRGAWFTGTLALVAVISTWYLPAYLINGQEFVQKFLIEQNLGRFSGGDAAHTTGIWSLGFYVPILLIGMFPWSLQLWKSWPRKSSSSPVERYLATWAATIFIFFSLSGAKLVHYVLPVCAPLALLVATQIQKRRPDFLAESTAIVVGAPLGLSLLLNAAHLYWYNASGQAEAHRIVATIPAGQKVSLFRMGRQNEDRGTGTTQLRETSLPSLMMVLNRATTDTDSLDKALEGQNYLFTRTGRIESYFKSPGRDPKLSLVGPLSIQNSGRRFSLKPLEAGTNFTLYKIDSVDSSLSSSP